ALRTAPTRTYACHSRPDLIAGSNDLVARHISNTPQQRPLDVHIGATLLADFALTAGAVTLEAVTVTAPVIETRTSEVATNVRPEQINNLPSSSRYFLDLAALAPGTTVTGDSLGGTAR